jgi:hypothetical protein
LGEINNEWSYTSIRNNDELEKLMRGEGVVKYIISQRIEWWGHRNRVEKTKGMESHRSET